jgi:hypothetical protein
MTERTVEDRLREEYFELLPDIRRVAEYLEANIRYSILPVSSRLAKHERLDVSSRVKECESAVAKLRRRQEGGAFDRTRREAYSVTSLHDLAGLRVLAFPRSFLPEIDRELRQRFPAWIADPVRGSREADEPIALKYYGHCEAVSRKVFAEYQIVPMLTGLFWEVEHAAIYKPDPRLKGVVGSRKMQQRTQEVLEALRAFEEEFETLIRRDPLARH